MITAVILAGGLGTRLRSVVPDLPKPMAPVNGRPFLACLMDYWLQQGIQHFVLSVGYRHQSIMDYFGSNYCGSPVEYVVEDTPLGTGGGLLLAVEKLSPNDPFLLLNGDTYFAVDMARLDAFARASQADWCFSLFRTDEAGRYMGMDVAANGQIIRLKSESVGGGGLANGGVYWVHPRALRDGAFAVGRSISLENDLFPAAVAAGQKLMGLEFCGTFIDIGVPADYQRAPVLLAA